MIPNYKRLRFKKLIPKSIKEKFCIPIRHWVKNKVLHINITQGHYAYAINVRKAGDQFSLLYKYSSRVASENFRFDTVSELLLFVMEKLKQDGLLTKEELMVKDILV